MPFSVNCISSDLSGLWVSVVQCLYWKSAFWNWRMLHFRVENFCKALDIQLHIACVPFSFNYPISFIIFSRICFNCSLVYWLTVSDWLIDMFLEWVTLLLRFISFALTANKWTVFVHGVFCVLSCLHRTDRRSSSTPGGSRGRGNNWWSGSSCSGVCGGCGDHWIAVWSGWGRTDRLVNSAV